MKTDAEFFDEEENLLAEHNVHNIRVLPTRQPRWALLHFLGLYLLIAVQAAVLLWFHYRVPHDPSQLIYSPAVDVVDYHVVDFGKYFLRRNEYMGELGRLPTDEVDALWSDLYELGFSGIPKWQADKLDNKTEPIPGTDTYLVELDVFHQLHCLDLVHMALYPDRYGKWATHPNSTINTKATLFQHWEHCIDGLRQSIMCHADISPLQFRINAINGILAPDLATRHTCRNFSKIHQWAKEREAPDYEPKAALGLSDKEGGFTLKEAIDTEV